MNGKRPVDAIIFDLDGTLVDSLSDLSAAVNHVLSLRGRPAHAPEEIRKFVGDGLGNLLARAIGTDDPAEIRTAAGDFRPYYDAHCLDATRPFNGVLDTLEKFSGKKMAVVSNKPLAFTRKILDGLGLAPYFGAVLGPESVKRQKPDPDSFLKVSAEFGVPPNRICAVGDRPTDIEAGRSAGMFTVGVTYGLGNPAEIADARPDAMIPRIGDLEKYIE